MFRTLLLPELLGNYMLCFCAFGVAAFLKQHIQANYLTTGNFLDYPK